MTRVVLRADAQIKWENSNEYKWSTNRINEEVAAAQCTLISYYRAKYSNYFWTVYSDLCINWLKLWFRENHWKFKKNIKTINSGDFKRRHFKKKIQIWLVFFWRRFIAVGKPRCGQLHWECVITFVRCFEHNTSREKLLKSVSFFSNSIWMQCTCFTSFVWKKIAIVSQT